MAASVDSYLSDETFILDNRENITAYFTALSRINLTKKKNIYHYMLGLLYQYHTESTNTALSTFTFYPLFNVKKS